MWGRHLKKRGRWWHYYRYVPGRYRHIDQRKYITFSLHTCDIAQAKHLAADYSLQFDKQWAEAAHKCKMTRSTSLTDRYQAAAKTQKQLGLTPKPLAQISDQELIERLRLIFIGQPLAPDYPAILGLADQPELSIDHAFDRFWEHITDEWRGVSHDQRRVKLNTYRRALANFIGAVGDIPLHKLERKHALMFRKWWIMRLEKESLKPNTGNKELNVMRRLVSVNFDIDSVERSNPFARVRLKDDRQSTRVPFETEQIRRFLKPNALDNMHSDFHILLRLLVNTGLRPVEAIGVELSDVVLDHAVPHIVIRKNAIRQLKTPHSERKIPLLGVSLLAAEQLVAQDGWGARAGKNMYATTIINRKIRESGVELHKGQSLYSLRHWFQDQLTKRDVIDRAQAQLMGHKFHRPKYGLGKDLSELHAIIAPFAL